MGTDTILGLRLGAEAPGQTGPFSSGPGESGGSLSRAGARDQRPGSCWPGELQGPGPDRARLRARPISRAPPGLRPPPAPSALCSTSQASPAETLLGRTRQAQQTPRRGLGLLPPRPPAFQPLPAMLGGQTAGQSRGPGPRDPGEASRGRPVLLGLYGGDEAQESRAGGAGGQGEALSPTGGLGSPAARRPSSVRGRWLSPGPTQCGEQAACGVPAPSLPGGPGHWGWDKEQAAETPELGPARAGGERGPGEGRGPRAPSAGRGENRLTTSADL